jgi:hypothetical protein
MVQWTPAYSVFSTLGAICLAGLGASLWWKPGRQLCRDPEKMVGGGSLYQMQVRDRRKPGGR